MMRNRNSKVKVRSPDGDTDYNDIVAGVLQGDSLTPYLFIICLDYVLRTSFGKMKENGFKLTKERSRRYPAPTITDADNADDIALLANAPAQAETLPHSLERAAGIGLYINAHKTEYKCFNLRGDISTLNGSSLKLVNKFTYLRSSVSSTEKDINMQLAKVWAAIDRLLVIWKSDLTDKMTGSFLRVVVVSILLYGCTTINKSWKQHPTKQQLYGYLLPITKTIQVTGTRHAGHSRKSRDELISDIFLWTLSHGRAKAGQTARTCIQ